MNRSDENACVGYGKENVQGGGLGIGGGKAPGQVGRTRRALSAINRNVVAPVRPPVIRKRGLIKEKQVVPDKVPQFPPVGRPMTRSFAAQLANKQQPCLLDDFVPSSSNPFPYPVNSKSSNPNPIALEDCIIVDVEEYRAANDFKTPLIAEEEMIDKIDEMEEDYESDEDKMAVQTGRKRPRNAAIRNDIDDNDRNDPLAVVEYISDIYSFHKKIENSGCVPPNYMDRQLDINEKMRTILIDWLIEVHYKFELMDETLFLMVNLIDRFLAREMVERKKLQLVGVTALLVASKYEEISVPIVNDLLVITDKAYTRQDVLNMERLIVNRLQFNMTVPTPYVFLRRFLKVVQSDRKLEFLSLFMVELCLVEYEMLKFPPSLLAAAAIFTAQCTINRFKHWDDTSEWHTTYSEEQLLECSKMMVGFHQRAGTGKHTGVHKKYSLIKFGHVARCEPASFLLQTRL